MKIETKLVQAVKGEKEQAKRLAELNKEICGLMIKSPVLYSVYYNKLNRTRSYFTSRLGRCDFPLSDLIIFYEIMNKNLMNL